MNKLKFADVRHEAWAAILRTQKIVTEAVQTALGEAGLPPLEWYDVLLELKMAPGKALKQHELAEAVVLAKFNLTRLLDRMESEGVISRRPCAEDRRVKYACIESKGEILLRQMWPVYQQTLDAHFSAQISEADAKQMQQALSQVRR